MGATCSRRRNQSCVFPLIFSVVQAPQSDLITCHDYNAVNARPKNKWTSMQRMIIGWLASSYSNPRYEIRKIFNIYFRDELPTTQVSSMGAVTSMSLSLKLQENEKAAIAALQSSSSSTKSVGSEGVAGNLVKQTASKSNGSVWQLEWERLTT